MSLLRELQLLTERTYQVSTGINLEEFLIGRKRFSNLSRFCAEHSRDLSDLARVFFRLAGDNLYLAIYFAEEIITALERHDPRKGLHEKNIYPFIVFIEEINHGVHVALKFVRGETDLQDERAIRDLELMAKVDTYHILKFFLAYFNDSRQLEQFDRLWLRFHLFERPEFSYRTGLLVRRYQETNQLGAKFTRFLDGLSPAHRRQELRRFHRFPYELKTRYIRMLP